MAWSGREPRGNVEYVRVIYAGSLAGRASWLSGVRTGVVRGGAPTEGAPSQSGGRPS